MSNSFYAPLDATVSTLAETMNKTAKTTNVSALFNSSNAVTAVSAYQKFGPATARKTVSTALMSSAANQNVNRIRFLATAGSRV